MILVFNLPNVLLLLTVLNNGFQQLVNAPTRDNNILDLILCNNNLAVTGIMHLPPFSTSDHSCLSWQNWFLKANNKNDAKHIANCSSYNFAKADYDKLHNYLSDVDWLNAFAASDPMDTSNYGWPSKIFYSMLSQFQFLSANLLELQSNMFIQNICIMH